MHKKLIHPDPMHPPELIKGTLQTIILNLLASKGRMYGYEITQKVKELSQGRILLTEGALYPTLHKLENDGLLITETENIGRRVRKYYSVTPVGTSLAKRKLMEFSDFIKTMQLVLQSDALPQV